MPSDHPAFRPLPDLAPEDADSHDELTPEAAASPARSGSRPAVWASMLVFGLLGSIVLVGVLATHADSQSNTEDMSREVIAEPMAAFPPAEPGETFSFQSLDIHPDRLHGAYFAGAFAGSDVPGGAVDPVANDFLWRLDMYKNAYGVDDNFTVRVIDERSGETLEVATLNEVRDSFAGRGQAAWDGVNRHRRVLTRSLREKWDAYGIPKSAIVIRWGYKDQTAEARERDAPYIEYETQLVRRLGLSVLATEIGTVETFNQDQLVSSAGARSRYQMMPDILRMFNVEQYTLRAASGETIQVREEHHPLLSMEPSLMLVRAYANAVGHELPGISAYHTGPGNIFKLYGQYLRAHPELVQARGKHVSDAYMWGVTDGFERVDAVSSFGPQSRVYLLKAYGALRATENEAIDPGTSRRVERVQVRPGTSTTLTRILTALDGKDRRLMWGDDLQRLSLYERFRALNPHIALPVSSTGDIPTAGDIRLTASSDNEPVRFFLPAGATSVLRRVGLDVIGTVTEFDDDVYLVDDSEITRTDREYIKLVEDVGRFGFTRANQGRMDRIHDALQDLARQQPDSRYRETQAKIARIHRSIWRTKAFRDLVAATEALYATNPRVRMDRDDMAEIQPRPPAVDAATTSEDQVAY
ncbi:MAG: hypothetical protein Rubg2KO_19340 [Rubricoccaceae bacterium]